MITLLELNDENLTSYCESHHGLAIKYGFRTNTTEMVNNTQCCNS